MARARVMSGTMLLKTRETEGWETPYMPWRSSATVTSTYCPTLRRRTFRQWTWRSLTSWPHLTIS